MLDHSPLHTMRGSEPAGSSAGAERFITYNDIVFFCRRYIATIVTCVTAGVLCALLYVLIAEPTYTASAQILIEPSRPQLVQDQASEFGLSLDTAEIESQIAVLRSEKIALMVIDDLDLLADPEFRSAAPSKLDMLRALAGRITAPLLPVGAGNGETAWDRLVSNVTRWLMKEPQAPTGFERTRLALDIFNSRLDVRRLGLSHALQVSIYSNDAQKAARLANATVDAFIREQMEAKLAAAQQGTDWMKRRIDEVRNQMNAATQAVQQFRASYDYSIPPPASEGGTGEDIEQPTLEELEATAETYRRMYQSFLQAFTTAVYRQSYPVADARVISAAAKPLNRSSPRGKLALALGALLGLMSGVGVALMRHSLDRSIHSAGQIRTQLGLDCLGELPCPPTGVGAFGRYTAVMEEPFSFFSDCLRNVRTAITLADIPQPVRTLGIASSLEREGKSTLASNLATLSGMAGVHTLVIDADIYTDGLSGVVAPQASGGLLQALKGVETVNEYIIPLETGYDLLPSQITHMVSPVDLLSSQKMPALIRKLSETYDLIIVDLPPIKAVPDGLALSPLLDGIVLVTEWSRTPIDLIIDVTRSLRAAKATIIGTVVTKVAALKSSRTYRHIEHPVWHGLPEAIAVSHRRERHPA